MRHDLYLADLFAGGGGFSTGIAEACKQLGKKPDLVAINHWKVAVETHKKNHPWARHLCTGLDAVNPTVEVRGGRLNLLAASPECTHHSNARGGKPMNDQSRSSAWLMRSTSKTKAAPCVLIINAVCRDRFAVEIDGRGVVDYNSRSHHQSARVYDLLPRNFNSSRIASRRADLERFDQDDLALIRYGYALDFDGRIYGCLPLTRPAEWTVFWFPPYGPGEFRYPDFKQRDRECKLFAGAWHFESHGGAKHLGYKYGHVWATRHVEHRLEEIRTFLKGQFPDIIEQHSSVVRWTKEGVTYTGLREPGNCPALSCGTVMEGGQFSYTTAHITEGL
jgi:hypothetical protein